MPRLNFTVFRPSARFCPHSVEELISRFDISVSLNAFFFRLSFVEELVLLWRLGLLGDLLSVGASVIRLITGHGGIAVGWPVEFSGSSESAHSVDGAD